MTVAELINELKRLNPNERIIVEVKEKKENPLNMLNRYHKADIKKIAYHMDGEGNNAYVIETKNAFIEYTRDEKLF